jgi:pilus assembly protein CpaB
MKPKTIALMVVAITCGLGASYMTSRLLAERNNNAATEEAKVTILQAKEKISPYRIIREPQAVFELKEVPESVAPPKAVSKLEEIQGKQLTRAVGKGQYVTADDVLTDSTADITSRLPEGMRAITVKVTPESGVGGFILPNSRVDVVSINRIGNEPSARVILQKMLVLAADVRDTRDEGSKVIQATNVTLAATPEETNRLVLASANGGEIRLVLRRPDDEHQNTAREVKWSDLSRPTSSTEVVKKDDEPPAPVVTTPVPPPVDVKQDDKKDDEPPTKKFIQTFRIGESESKVVYIQNDDGTFKTGVGSGSSDEESSKPAPKTAPAPAPAPTPAPAKTSDGKPANG